MSCLNKLRKKIELYEDITIDFVGDSITHGLNHCSSEETYVAKFARFLSDHFREYTVCRYDGIVESELLPMKRFEGPVLISLGGKCRIDVIRNGIGGNTVMRAYNRIDDFTGVLANVNGKSPDVTFLMFGINDALKSDPKKYVSADDFGSNYKMLVDEIKKRNPDTFIIIMGATTNDQSIEEHCKKSEELAREENIPYIDLRRLWTEHYDIKADNFGYGDWLAGGMDSCHPTPKAAEIMASYIFDEFIRIIEV